VAGGWKQQWRAFRSARPGTRFEERYERSQKTRTSQSWFLRVLKPAAALVLVAAGVVLCFIPGPGIPLLVIGAGLLGDESRVIARALDGLEVRARKVIARGRRWWRGASRMARDAAITAAVIVMCGIAYGGYRFIASH
jgi:hypothetical protein